MFRGSHYLSLDEKGRLSMPAKNRKGLMEACEGNLVVTIENEQCLLLYTLPEWEKIEKKISALPSLDPRAQVLKHVLIGNATDVNMDKSGRFLVPQHLREFANLDKQTVLVGQGNKYEIWDEQRWRNKSLEWLKPDKDGDRNALIGDLESLSF